MLPKSQKNGKMHLHMKEKRKDNRINRQRANRYGFTINNPFITENIKVINPDKMTDEQKAIFQDKRHDYSHLKTPENEQYFDFILTEYVVNKVKDDDSTAHTIITERIFFKSYEMAEAYFKTIPFIDYFCFQYEKGEEKGVLHLQGYMHFDRPMDMKTVHKLFPTSHLTACYGSNQESIDYCSKSKSRVDGYDFIESGKKPAEIGSRTDLSELIEDIIANLPYDEMLRKYPWHMLNMGDKIEKLRQNHLREKFKNIERQIHTTYIYGAEGTGKTTFAYRVLGLQFMEVFKVSNYKHSGKFDSYSCQDVILFDEFLSQIELTEMNNMLNGQPFPFPCRFTDRWACFTKAIFTSNYPLDEQYREERSKGKEPSFKGFLRRINEIIYMPEQDLYIWQKGQPSEQVIAELERQGAKYRIDSPTEQLKIKGVQ